MVWKSLLKRMGTPKNCLRVNRKLLPLKLHYFLFMAALACALPFRTVFAKQLGISATELGVIFCAVPFLRIITNPFFGFILDYFKKIRLTISVIMIIVAISLLCLVFIPPKTSAVHSRQSTTEDDVYTKLKYICNTTLYTGDHRLLMYSEYRMIGNSARIKNNIACDIQCSDSVSKISVNDTKNILQFSPEMRFDLRVHVDVSSCENNIRLEKIKLIISNDNIQNSVLIGVNDSLVRRFKSKTPPYENCSTETTTQLLFLRTHRKTSKSDLSDLVQVFDNGSEYVSLTVPRIADSEKQRYYVLHEYVVNAPADDFASNSACGTEFECSTKKCFIRNQKDVFYPETLVEEDEFLSPQFWSLFVLFAISSVMFSAIMFMMDAVCYELLQDRRHLYGQQRMFGTIGWGIGALVGGFLNQIVPSEFGETDYTMSFYMLAVLIIIDLYPVYELKVTDLKYSPHILKDVCFLFTKFDIIYNLIIVYIIGILSGLIWNYQFWFMQEIGSSQILLGLSQTFECLFELPCFLASGWIISKIGHEHCNSITLLFFGLRYLCFVFMYNPWWTLAAGLLHGPTFGLFYTSMTMYAKNEAPAGTEATVQSLLHLSFEGIGTAVGSILGGVGLDKFGSRMSFMYAAEISFFVFFINIFMTFLFFSAKKKSKKIEHSVPLS